MSQTTYATRRTVAFEGMDIAGDGDDFVMGFDPTNELHFGRLVIRGADDDEVAHPSGSAGTPIGVTVHSMSVDPSQVTTNDWPADEPISIKRRGRVWVFTEEAVTQGDPVYYRHASPGALPEAFGRFRNDADTADATLLAGARFATTVAAAGLAILELNLP